MNRDKRIKHLSKTFLNFYKPYGQLTQLQIEKKNLQKIHQKLSKVAFDGTFDSFCDMLKRSSKGIWQVYSCPYSCISPWQKKSTFDVKNFTFDVKSKIFDIKSWFFWQCESSFRTKTKCSLSSTKFLLNLNMKLPRTHMANYLRKCFRKCNLIASLLVKSSNHQN